MELGAKISEYLKENGIKQAYLVEKTGIPAYAISDICTGDRKSIDVLAYYKICKALGVDLMTFISEGEAEV